MDQSIEAMYVGCMSRRPLLGTGAHRRPRWPTTSGVPPIPATRVESACASGGTAFAAGLMEVASGYHDMVLVGGVEKMTDVDGGGATCALAAAADAEYEAYHGVTFPGLYAMMARAHMAKYGTTREQLAMVAVKNHANGSKNPHAQYREPVDAGAGPQGDEGRRPAQHPRLLARSRTARPRAHRAAEDGAGRSRRTSGPR